MRMLQAVVRTLNEVLLKLLFGVRELISLMPISREPRYLAISEVIQTLPLVRTAFNA
jgi:hypothetical protein